MPRPNYRRGETNADKLVKKYNDLLPYFGKNKQILDFGSGDGKIITNLANITHNKLTLCDIEDNRHQSLQNNQIPFILIKLDTPIPLIDKSIDVITALQVLHHVVDIESRLKDLYRILKVGGKLIIREHDFSSQNVVDIVEQEHLFYEIFEKTFKQLISEVEFCEFVKKYHESKSAFVNTFSYEELKNKLEKIGFKLLYEHDLKTASHIYHLVMEKV